MKKQSSVMIALGVVLVLGVLVTIMMMNGGKQDPPVTNNTNANTNKISPTPVAAPADAVEANAVTIKDYAYGPKDIKVKVGTTVTWTNQDSVRHDISADKPSADAPQSDLLAKGDSYSFTFKKAGNYGYYCGPHQYMKASVTVTE